MDHQHFSPPSAFSRELISFVVNLFNFGISLLVAWLIWRSYRNSSFTLAQKYSTFWPRLWTGVIDGWVLWPLRLISSLPVLLHLAPVIVVISALLSNAIGLTYRVWMHARFGQTVGKIVCKVRVVDNLTEGKISVRQALLRECIPLVASLGASGYFLYLLGCGALYGEAALHPERAVNWRVFGPLMAIPAIWSLVEIVTMFSNEKRRALHDFIAGTTSVRTHLVESQT